MSRLKSILEEECKILERSLNQRKSLLNVLPYGSLSIRTHGTHSYLYLTRTKIINGIAKRIQVVLHERDRRMITQLRRRKRIEKQIPLMEENLKRLTDLLEHYHVCDDQSISKTLPPAYQDRFDFRGFDADAPLTASQAGNFHPESLIHKNSAGELFRSKGEVQISELLRTRKIAYRYEQRIQINGHWLLPDFAFELPATDRTVYLEFCGMMDNDDYFQDTIRKIQLYLNSGYVSGRDVLFLLESKSSGSDLAAMTRQLDSFLAQ